MTPAPSPRRPLLIIAALCLGGVALALTSQYVFDMPPCAWCVLQRLIYLAIAAFALIGAAGVTNVACWVERSEAQQTTHRVLGTTHRAFQSIRVFPISLLFICLLLSLAGIAAAWYQHSVAAQMFSCDQTFADRFMTRTGLETALPWLFGIYASCMDAAVSVLGIEYALWSLMLFAVIAGISLVGLLGRLGRPSRLASYKL